MNTFSEHAYPSPLAICALLKLFALSAMPLVGHAADRGMPPLLPTAGHVAPSSAVEPHPGTLEPSQLVGSIKDVQESLGQQRSTSPVPPSNSSRSPAPQQQLAQAASGCKNAYNRAYEKLLERKRAALRDGQMRIPKLQACIADASSWVEKHRKLRIQVKETMERNEIEQKSLRQEIAPLEKLQSEEGHLAVHGKAWTARQAKVDLLNSRLARSRDEHAKLQSREAWLNNEIKIQLAQQVNCEASLSTLRTRIVEEESALKGKVPGVIDAHRQKRFTEIEKLRQNGDLAALKRCADQGDLALDDLMRQLFR